MKEVMECSRGRSTSPDAAHSNTEQTPVLSISTALTAEIEQPT